QMKLAKSVLVMSILAAAALSSVGCGGGKEPETPAGKSGPVGPKTAAGEAVTEAAEDKFNDALDAFNAHDKANDWNDAACSDMASKFSAAASEQKGGKFPEA